jgi:ketosteroid isomerase-like protein
MTTDFSANLATVKRFYDAIERGDVETVKNCCTDDALFWRNYDFSQTSVPNISRGLKWLSRTFEGFRYGERRAVIGADGSVFEQHVLQGKAASGVELNVPIMVRMHFREGLISALDEYTDSAQMRVVVMEQLFAVLRTYD